jgi:signal transduction histidine kinase
MNPLKALRSERPGLVELGVVDDRDAGALVVTVLGGLSVLGGLAGVIGLVHPPHDVEFRPLPIIAICLVGLVVTALLATHPGIVRARHLAPVGSIGLLTLGVAAYFSGARFFPFVVAYFMLIAAAFPFQSRRAALANLGLVLGVTAIVIAVQPGHWDGLVEWELIAGFIVLATAVIEWVVRRITSMAVDERQARDELEDATARLAAVNEQKREFLAMTSHELRTPLNAIIGFSDVLGERLCGPLNERQADYVEDIRSSGQHLLGLIDEVLDMAKVEAGTLDLDLATIDVGELVSGVGALFRQEAANRRISLDVRVPRGVRVVADERKVRQVVMNLVANAVRLTPTGGKITMSARTSGPQVHIDVADTGPGIAPADLDRIFHAYEQAARSQTGGTGLGLPLARRFIEAHGGRLTVRSDVGAGSNFRVVLHRTPLPPVPENVGVGGGRPRVPTPDQLMRDTTQVATMFCAGIVAIVGLAALLIVVRHDSIPGFRLQSLYVVVAIGVGVGVVLYRTERAVSANVYAVVAVGFGALIAVDMYWTGALFGPLGAPAFVWACLASFMVLPRRTAVVVAATAMSFYAGLLVAQPGNVDPVLRWELTSGACAGASWLMVWLMARLHAATVAEHRARVGVERSLEELERVSRHKSEFLANMSHELRTPLNAIIGFAAVLGEGLFGALNDKQSEYTADIVQSGHQLLDLINDILDLAKAEAGRVELHLDEVAVADLVRVAVNSVRPWAEELGLILDVEVAPDAGRVEADAPRLSRVLSNVLSNAVRFSPVGGRVSVAATRDDGEVVVAVRDQGPGISASDHQRIFEEFQRVTPVTMAAPGTGLGLALARAFAELHHGRLEVDSAPGEGSTFRLAVPVAARRQTVIG